MLTSLLQLATKVTTFFIEHFGRKALFGSENYEYYAHKTGRILKVDQEWIFFTYPIMFGSNQDAQQQQQQQQDAQQHQLGAAAVESSMNPGAAAAQVPKAAVLHYSLDDMNMQTVGSLASPSGDERPLEKTGSLEIIPENCPLDPKGRLSISLDEANISSPSSCGSPSHGNVFEHELTAVRTASKPARGQEVKSYTCLPQVRTVPTFYSSERYRYHWILRRMQ